jgi:hypothetical protein
MFVITFIFIVRQFTGIAPPLPTAFSVVSLHLNRHTNGLNSDVTAGMKTRLFQMFSL